LKPKITWVFKVFLFSFCLALLSQSVGLTSYEETTSECVGCHEGMDTVLALTSHRLVSTPEGNRLQNFPSSCADCHPNGENHLQEPQLGNITNPSKTNFLEDLEICTQCHSNPHAENEPQFNAHSKNKVNCSSCHSIHHSQENHLLVSSPNDLCLSCHQEVGAKFLSVSHHPVPQKIILCIDCHRLSEPLDRPLSSATVDVECFSCHAEYQGPFPYEHGATNDYTVEKEGCIYCHDPHGSPNPRLLKQPDRALCLNCHFVPRHQTAHEGIWAKTDCLECHVDVHGSYTDKNLLGEDIFGGSCFVYGCHVH
jgi:DmsE family decaheme c-type cytochrome